MSMIQITFSPCHQTSAIGGPGKLLVFKKSVSMSAYSWEQFMNSLHPELHFMHAYGIQHVEPTG
jgi:hypothetical protein